jgi:hypothetical protein
MTDREETSTREQRQWKKLARAVRVGLAKIAPRLPEAHPLEALQFAKACQEALKFSTWAATFDHDVKHTLDRQPYDNDD